MRARRCSTGSLPVGTAGASSSVSTTPTGNARVRNMPMPFSMICIGSGSSRTLPNISRSVSITTGLRSTGCERQDCSTPATKRPRNWICAARSAAPAASLLSMAARRWHSRANRSRNTSRMDASLTGASCFQTSEVIRRSPSAPKSPGAIWCEARRPSTWHRCQTRFWFARTARFSIRCRRWWMTSTWASAMSFAVTTTSPTPECRSPLRRRSAPNRRFSATTTC